MVWNLVSLSRSSRSLCARRREVRLSAPMPAMTKAMLSRLMLVIRMTERFQPARKMVSGTASETTSG
jgi:hypothetical protein